MRQGYAAPVEAVLEPSDEAQWGARLAGEVLRETGLAAHDPNLQDRHERKRRRVRDWQAQLLRSTILPARERALVGDLLAHLGETRQHLLDVYYLRFSLVPRGPFWMGEEGSEHAKLHCNEGVNYDYWIAQTAVTVAQFQQFVTSNGYDPRSSNWSQDAENRPVAGVTWHDAQAFCLWLTQRWQNQLPVGWRVTLPSEAEWEKAARGGVRVPRAVKVATVGQGFLPVATEMHDNPLPQRTFPWGDAFRVGNLNVEGNVGSTSTPGCFHQGRSPYDCEDMSGNVWEWTRSLWGKNWEKPDFAYPYMPDDRKREDLEAGNVSRGARGGSWDLGPGLARCAYRLRLPPDLRSPNVGFRVVLRSALVPSL